MASKHEKQEIRKQAKNGQSVNQITEKLGLPKSTVYYHFKKEVGQKQKENALKIPKNPETQGELCGIFAGDGNFQKRKEGHYRTKIFLNLNEEYWQILADFLEDKLEKRPHVYQYPDKSGATLDYSSKPLYLLFKQNLDWEEDKTATICLAADKEHSKEFKIGFLRGLLDTDGHSSKSIRRSRFNTISRQLSKDVSKILTELNLDNSITVEPDNRENCRTMYRTQVYGNAAIRLTELIEPRNPKKRCELSRL